MGVNNINTNHNIDKDFKLNPIDVINFFKDKPVIESNKTANTYLIGSKGNLLIVYKYNKNEQDLSIDTYKIDFLTKLTDGSFNLNGGIKTEFEMNFKNLLSINKSKYKDFLEDNEIKFGDNINLSKYYFMNISANYIGNIGDIVNIIPYNDEVLKEIELNEHRNYLLAMRDIIDGLGRGTSSVKKCFLSLEQLNLYKEVVEIEYEFKKLFSDKYMNMYYLAYFKNNNREKTYNGFIDFLQNENDKFNKIFQNYTKELIIEQIKEFEERTGKK